MYLGINPLLAAGSILHTAVEVDGQHVLGTSLLPWVSKPEPVIGLLSLAMKGSL